MALSTKIPLSSLFVKYLMFIFNLLFVITGIILISIGGVIYGTFKGYYHFLDDRFLSVPSLLIAIGTIIFIIAFFGCCGAARQSYCLMITFTFLLVVIFIMEIAGGIAGYVLKAQASELVKSKMLNSMSHYNTSEDVTLSWDVIQTEFHCCGVNNSSDWQIVKHFTETNILPPSCCPMQQCFRNSSNLYGKGCYPEIIASVKSHVLELGGAGFGIAFCQAIGIWFSIYLARSIRNSYETV